VCNLAGAKWANVPANWACIQRVWSKAFFETIDIEQNTLKASICKEILRFSALFFGTS
jgi:hypothetical protein